MTEDEHYQRYMEHYMLTMANPTKDKTACLQKKTGTCAGCSIIPIAAEVFRWQVVPPKQASIQVGEIYCPTGLRPQEHIFINQDASYALGQDHSEMTEFRGRDPVPNGRKLHRTY